MCLPYKSRRDNGIIQIPRGKCRARLAEAGLLGKGELTSAMDPDEVKSEICQVFMIPMALSKDDIVNKRFFEFSYLQKTGMGSRSLCTPAVSSNFEWNGRQVAGLARSGGFIYILAGGCLSGCNLETSFKEESLMISSSSEDELPSAKHLLSNVVAISSDENEDKEKEEQASGSCDTSEPSIRSTECSLDVNTQCCDSDHPSSSVTENKGGGKLKLRGVFIGKLSPDQTDCVFKISGEDFTSTMECLPAGPTLESLLMILSKRCAEQPVIKLDVDTTEAWEDAIAFYKSPRLDTSKQIRVRINNQQVIDAGGVRAQLYSSIYDIFAQNKKIMLFDGDVRYLRPHCSAEARSSGLYKTLGMMVGHSIMQDGIGFAYFSPVCYWYVAGQEQKALESLSIKDLNQDIAILVSKLRDASTKAELSELINKDGATNCCDPMDVMSRCGVKTVLNLSTKSLIAQDIATYEGLYKMTHLLDQFCDGLKKAGLLDIIRMFADQFLPLFVYTKLTAADVLAAVYVSAEQKSNPEHEVLLGYFNRFILECDEIGLRQFMCHVTGAELPHRKIIQVEFDEDAYGAISAYTCSKVITFPSHGFDTYDVFKESLQAVISGPPTFNTY